MTCNECDSTGVVEVLATPQPTEVDDEGDMVCVTVRVICACQLTKLTTTEATPTRMRWRP